MFFMSHFTQKATALVLALSLTVLTVTSLCACGKTTPPAADTTTEATTTAIAITTTVTTMSTTTVTTMSTTTTAATTAVTPVTDKNVQKLMGQNAVELSVKWHTGYVGSSTNGYGYANRLNPGGSGYAYSDVIELGERGTKILFADKYRKSTSTNAYCISFWHKTGSTWTLDANAQNLSGEPLEVVSDNTALGKVYSYVSSEDGECVRLCYRSDGSEKTNPPAVYLAHTGETGTFAAQDAERNALREWLENDKNRAYYDFLAGKTVNFIGDSYFDGNGLDRAYTWPSMFAEKYGMTMENYGMNGSTMSNYVTTNHPICDRYQSMANNDPDIIVVGGGRNDFNQSAPIGDNETNDTGTYKGALRTVLEGLRKKYPRAVIVCVTCWKVDSGTNKAGLTCTQYGQAMIELCQVMGVPVLNAMDQTATGVRMTDGLFRREYCLTPQDVSHLNPEGMKLALPFFERGIAMACREEWGK